MLQKQPSPSSFGYGFGEEHIKKGKGSLCRQCKRQNAQPGISLPCCSCIYWVASSLVPMLLAQYETCSAIPLNAQPWSLARCGEMEREISIPRWRIVVLPLRTRNTSRVGQKKSAKKESRSSLNIVQWLVVPTGWVWMMGE